MPCELTDLINKGSSCLNDKEEIQLLTWLDSYNESSLPAEKLLYKYAMNHYSSKNCHYPFVTSYVMVHTKLEYFITLFKEVNLQDMSPEKKGKLLDQMVKSLMVEKLT